MVIGRPSSPGAIVGPITRFRLNQVAQGTQGPAGPPGTATPPVYFSDLSSIGPSAISAGRQVIFTDGYTSPGDGGGGVFVWNGTDTRAADGGTIIAVTGIVTGRWNRVIAGDHNVKWFGAVGDNTHNDTTAFQNAIAAVLAQTAGGSLYIPAGTYKITSGLAPAPGSGQSIRIYGLGRTAILNVTVNDVAVTLGNRSSLKSVTVQGSNYGGVYALNVSNVVIEDCDITGGAAGPAGDFVNVSVRIGGTDITVQNNYVHGGSNASYPFAEIYVNSDGGANTRIRVLNNTISCGPSAYGILGYNSNDCLYEDNFVNGNNTIGSGSLLTAANSGYGIAVYDTGGENNDLTETVGRCSISNNTIVNTAGSGIYYQSGGAGVSPQSQAVILGNNLFNTCQQQTDGSLMCAAISVNGKSVVSGNNIMTVGAQGAGICSQGSGAVITSNKIEGVTGRAAIAIRQLLPGAAGGNPYNSGERSVISNNTIENCLNDGIQTGTAAIDSIQITGNILGWRYDAIQSAIAGGTNTLTVYEATYTNNQPVRFRVADGGTLPSGITAGTTYYVKNWTPGGTPNFGGTFQISASSGPGAAVSLTTTGSGLFEICVAGGTIGIHAQGNLTGSRICGNLIEGYAQDGIVTVGGSDNLINDNVISNCGQNSTPGTWYALVNNGLNTTIMGNRFLGASQGSMVDGGTYSRIIGNTFFGCTGNPTFDTTSTFIGSLGNNGAHYQQDATVHVAAATWQLGAQGIFANSPTLVETPVDGNGNARIDAQGSGVKLQLGYNADTILATSGGKLGLYGTVPIAQQSRVGALTDNSGGTPSTTIAATPAGYSQTQLANALASLAAKIAAIDTVLHNLGISA